MNTRQHHYQRIKTLLKCDEFDMYLFGSQVYGTALYDSDWDYYVIGLGFEVGQEIRNGDLNFHVMNPAHYQALLDQHHVGAVEIFFANNTPFEFNVDKTKLRSEFSRTASNSWVKAKKKLTVEPEEFRPIGLKSLWHSLRILQLGIQLAETGQIVDFSEANTYFEDIVHSNLDWEQLKEQYQPVYNSLASKFRNVAPKE